MIYIFHSHFCVGNKKTAPRMAQFFLKGLRPFLPSFLCKLPLLLRELLQLFLLLQQL